MPPQPSANHTKSTLRIRNQVFEMQHQLGRGSFGQCFLYRHKERHKCTVAVKVMQRTADNLTEMSVHRQMTHPHIVRMIHQMEVKFKGYNKQLYFLILMLKNTGVSTISKKRNCTLNIYLVANSLSAIMTRFLNLHTQTTNRYFLIMESCQHTLLSVFQNGSTEWTVARIQTVFKGVLSALVYIHQQNYVHRDIKLSNLLVKEGDCVKICDFGLVAKMGEPLKNFCGTVGYLAPESLLHLITNVHSCLDVWSLGCCLYTFLTGGQPFMRRSRDETVSRIRHGLYENSVEVMSKPGGQQLMQLLERIFEPNYERRITSVDLLADPFFSDAIEGVVVSECLVVEAICVC